jgi:uncharacterized protein (DUF2141 family)
MVFGAKQPGRPGTPIQLVEGQKLERATIGLPRGGVVTGIVVDDYGEPAPGTQVQVLRFVIRTGERTLQRAGQDSTDDRGMYRIYGLQPGDYMVSAMPRNPRGLSGLRETIAAEVEMLLQRAQASGGRAGGFANVGGRAGTAIERAAELQAQLAQEDEQTVAYAPVYYPGTTAPVNAFDFQLQLVATAKISGTVSGADGTLPPGTQLTLSPTNQDMPRIPGVNNNTSRPGQDGRFSFSNITPGQYRLMARAQIRETTAGQPQGGRGGRGARGAPLAEVLWASSDLTIAGEDLENMMLVLQPGMRVTGRIVFDGGSAPPEDLTQARVTLSQRDSQPAFGGGGSPSATVDASGTFTMNGVSPGRYALQATLTGGRGGRGGGRGGGQTTGNTAQWRLASATVNGIDTLDFPLSVEPNQDVGGAVLTFTDQTQELSGMLQDAMGRPTADFTIIVYPADEAYWTPQSRRIVSARPATDGQFAIRSLPPGQYRMTAVTDVEPGEWFNPSFLAQLVGASIPVSLSPGETKVQNIRLAGG